jgi:hypothetical protein
MLRLLRCATGLMTDDICSPSTCRPSKDRRTAQVRRLAGKHGPEFGSGERRAQDRLDTNYLF